MVYLIYLVCVLFVTEVAIGRTDPNTENNFMDMSIEELVKVEINTVTAASKYKQKTIEAPSSVTIITSEEIQKYGYRTLMDILNSIPGFYDTYDRNYGYIGVRGFGRRAIITHVSFC